MAPKQQRITVSRADAPRRNTPKSVIGNAYAELTAPENFGVVKSVGIFGVAIAFFASSLSEILLPPL